MFSMVPCISEMEYFKKNNVGRDLIKSIGFWLDGGRSERKLVVYCKKVENRLNY